MNTHGPNSHKNMLDDESTQTKTLCAFCGARPPGLRGHTRSRSARIGHGLGESRCRCNGMRQLGAVKRPTRWCDLRLIFSVHVRRSVGAARPGSQEAATSRARPLPSIVDRDGQ